ncbi:MAG: hypothetical protein Q7S94_01855 [Gallionella sp.]|nr:hypothetical protein [Gallionella sp.]
MTDAEIRFWNNPILQETDAVIEVIWVVLQSAAVTPHPQYSTTLGNQSMWQKQIAKFAANRSCANSMAAIAARFVKNVESARRIFTGY